MTVRDVSPSSSTPPPAEAEQIEQLKKKLQWAELKIQVLEERLRLELIAKYGPASEKLSDAQLELLQWEPGVSHVEVQAESEREAERAWTDKPHKRNHPGRQELPATCRGGKKCWPAHRNSAPAEPAASKRR